MQTTSTTFTLPSVTFTRKFHARLLITAHIHNMFINHLLNTFIKLTESSSIHWIRQRLGLRYHNSIIIIELVNSFLLGNYSSMALCLIKEVNN